MKAAELVNFSAKALKAMSEVGIRIGDYRHLVLWNDYRALVEDGNKKTYAIAKVSHRYGVSERTVARIIKRFDSDI